MTPTAPSRRLRATPRLGALASGLLLGLVLSGCRGCSGGSGGKLDETEASQKKEFKKKTSTARPAAEAVGNGGPIRTLAMRLPQVPEPEREVSEAVQQAKVLILEGTAEAAGAATEARSVLSQWLVDHPTDADAHYWLGRSWMSERIKVQAVAPYEKALEHDPTFVSAHRWLAYVLHAENRCAEAVPHLEAALTALPEDPTVHIDRAVCAVQLQEWDLLAQHLQTACDLGDTEICDTATLAQRMAERRKNLSKLKSERSDLKRGKGAKMRAGKAKGGPRVRGSGPAFLKGGKFGKVGGRTQPPPSEGTTDDGTTQDGTTEE